MKFALTLLAILIQTLCAQQNIYFYGNLYLPDLNISGTTNELNTFLLEQKPNYPFLGYCNNTISSGSTLIDVVGEFSNFPVETDSYLTFTWRFIFNLKDMFYGPYAQRYFFIEGNAVSIRGSGRTLINGTVSFAETEPEMNMPALTHFNGMVGYVDYPH